MQLFCTLYYRRLLVSCGTKTLCFPKKSQLTERTIIKITSVLTLKYQQENISYET